MLYLYPKSQAGLSEWYSLLSERADFDHFVLEMVFFIGSVLVIEKGNVGTFFMSLSVKKHPHTYVYGGEKNECNKNY